MCDRPAAGRVLDEARRLNMVDGHFVWIWIDTAPSNNTIGGTGLPTTDKPPTEPSRRDKREEEKIASRKMDEDKQSSDLVTGERDRNEMADQEFGVSDDVLNNAFYKRPLTRHKRVDSEVNSGAKDEIHNNKHGEKVNPHSFGTNHNRVDKSVGAEEDFSNDGTLYYNSEFSDNANGELIKTINGFSVNEESFGRTFANHRRTFLRDKRAVFDHKEFIKSDINDMHVNYLVKNDQFLLFNRQSGVESSKFKNLRDSVVSIKKEQSWKFHGFYGRRSTFSELPAGLLSIRALPMRVDRHLVKGAVKLLVGTLKTVLARCPDWLAQSIALEDLSTSCWSSPSAGEFNFSSVFAK